MYIQIVSTEYLTNCIFDKGNCSLLGKSATSFLEGMYCLILRNTPGQLKYITVVTSRMRCISYACSINNDVSCVCTNIRITVIIVLAVVYLAEKEKEKRERETDSGKTYVTYVKLYYFLYRGNLPR